jgi:hypothetical protein
MNTVEEVKNTTSETNIQPKGEGVGYTNQRSKNNFGPRPWDRVGREKLNMFSLFSYLSVCVSAWQVKARKEEKFVRDYGFVPIPMNKIHDHELASVAREIAELRVLNKIFIKHKMNGKKLKICDYFGSSRMSSKLRKLQTMAADHFHVDKKDVIRMFSFHWYRPLLTAKDRSYFSDLVEKFPSYLPSGECEIIMTDVYHLDPSHFLQYPEATVWNISQFFKSDTAGINFGTSPYFVKDGDLVQRSSEIMDLWVRHPHKITQVWQNRQVSDGPVQFSWIRNDAVSDYIIYQGSCGSVEYREETVPKRTGLTKIIGVGFLCYYFYHMLSLFSWTRPTFFTRKDSYVHMDIADKVMSTRPFNNRSAYHYSAVVAAVNEELKSHDCLFDFWEIPRHRVVMDTASYILFSSINVEADILSEAIDQTSDSLDKMRSLKGSTIKSRVLHPVSGLILFLFFVGLGWLSNQLALPVASAESILELDLTPNSQSLNPYDVYRSIRTLIYEYRFWMSFVTFFFMYKYVFLSYVVWFLDIVCSMFLIQFPRKGPVCPNFAIFRDLYSRLEHRDYCGPSFGGYPMYLPATVRDEEKVPGVGLHILLGTKAMMVRPNGLNQFFFAYEQRNRASVNEELTFCENLGCSFTRSMECLLESRWVILVDEIKKILSNVPKFSLTNATQKMKRLNWAKRMPTPAKRNRALTAVEQRSEGITSYRTEAFLKADEVLWPKMIDGRMAVKPRVVQAVDPFVQASCGSHISDFMNYLKEYVFNWDFPLLINGCKISFTIGSGKTSDDLSVWYSKAMAALELAPDYTYFVIVAGDDFFSLGKVAGEIVSLECDFSKYDRTQGIHALEAEWEILEFLGFPKKSINILREMAKTTPVFFDRKENVKHKMTAPIQRFTGAPDTTLGNSLVNIASVIYDVLKTGQLSLTTQKDLGFDTKRVEVAVTDGPTFLKGWWIPCDDVEVPWRWVPLPSQVVKMGKCLTAPWTIFPQVDPMTAHKMVAKGMAMSYGSVPDDYPILGAFCKKYKSLYSGKVDYDFSNPYKTAIESSGIRGNLDLPQCHYLFTIRYGFTPGDIAEMEKEIVETEFPGIMASDLWVRLGERDYG